MHDRKLIHRDVKPDNIYLDKDLNCMLSDMGIARSSDCSLKTQIGTPRYTAPEVWKVCFQGDNENFAEYDS
jgi:serine/threonine protein kinase